MNDAPSRLNLIQRAMQQQARQDPAAAGSAETSRDPASLPPPQPLATEAKLASRPVVSAGEVALNYERLRAARIPLPGEKNSVTFNEFRSVKRKLLPLASRMGERRPTNLVMITSALPSEGKTFSSVNLAITLAAEKNLSVILVDGDVIRGTLKEYFSGPSEKGLLDLFGNSPCKAEEVLHRCADVPNLHVLFSGAHNDAAPELFASARMSDICYALSKRFSPGIVIIDSPPILFTSEPTSLAAHVDQVVMVVAAGKSNRQQVESSLSRIAACKNIAVLFNKAPKWQLPSQGTYYYHASPSA